MYPSGVLIPIQGLRAIAALGVVLHHVQYEARTRLGMPDALPYFEYGALGVDLFFVVSGFVMVYASGPLFAKAEGARIFMARRIIRIVPLYWLCTGVYVAFALLAPQLARTHYGADVVAASLLFYPYERPDIGMFPVVGQGWTLNYEMLFYAVFSACILLPRRQAVLAVAAVFAALSITGRTVDLPQPFAFWASPIILEFVLGAVLGLLYVEGWWRLPAVAATGIVWRGLSLLGDASYALYLFHPICIRAAREAATRVGVASANLWVYLVIVTVFASIAAVVIHLLIERPVTSWLRSRFGV